VNSENFKVKGKGMYLKLLFFAVFFKASLLSVYADSQPVIILKLDDLTGITPRWQNCLDFLKQEKVKASFGIIGYALEKKNDVFFKWVRDLHDEGQIEFWNHGYKMRTSQDKSGEFESDSVAEQTQALLRTQQLAKEKLGLSLSAFGPHWSATNQATIEALKAIPEIKIVFYYTAGEKRDWFVFERFLNMEQPTFVPNFDFVSKQYEASAHEKPYLCFQGHPNAWDENRFEQFKKVVLFFKSKGCRFMTPSEYLNLSK